MAEIRDNSFRSDIYGAQNKLSRLHELLMKAHQSSIMDEHLLWKSCLDAVYRELFAYCTEEIDKVSEINKIKKSVESSIVNYLRLQNQNSNMAYYEKQQVQIEMEGLLDDYEKKLINTMKNHNLDLQSQKETKHQVM